MDNISNLTIDELNAQLLDLNVEYAAKKSERDTCYRALNEHILKTIKSNVSADVNVSCTSDSASIDVGSHSISLYFDTPYSTANLNQSRVLRMNFSCFGSFGTNDADEIKYCELLGHVAGIMNLLEHHIIKTTYAQSLWDAYDKAAREARSAWSKLQSVTDEIKHHEIASQKQKVLADLVVGRKIMTFKPTIYHQAQYKTIEKITKKNIMFEEDYGHRTSKDVVVEKVMSGKWVI